MGRGRVEVGFDGSGSAADGEQQEQIGGTKRLAATYKSFRNDDQAAGSI